MSWDLVVKVLVVGMYLGLNMRVRISEKLSRFGQKSQDTSFDISFDSQPPLPVGSFITEDSVLVPDGRARAKHQLSDQRCRRYRHRLLQVGAQRLIRCYRHHLHLATNRPPILKSRSSLKRRRNGFERSGIVLARSAKAVSLRRRRPICHLSICGR